MNQPRISIIVAVDKKRGIGRKNALPWYIPEDLKRFRRLTTGHVVIMGRKTFESIINRIGKPLPNRTSIIITRDKNFDISIYENVAVCYSLDEAVKRAKEIEAASAKASASQGEIFIIGGGEVYNQAVNKVDRLYLTYIDYDFDADVFFPDYSDFKKIVAEEPKQEESEYNYKFLTLER